MYHTTPSQTFRSYHCGISDDFENDTVDSLSNSDDEHGPLLPLAVSNTLNNIADIFLDTFKKVMIRSQDILKSVRCFPPETLKATLRIFRLMKRLYPANGR